MNGFYDDPESAETYVSMAKGYDGAELIAELGTILSEGAAVLELGMGPGVDLDLLSRRYNATGSDISDYFIERYRKSHPDADLIKLDAVALATDRTFDALYSNKVLHHLTDEQLAQSLSRQVQLLKPGGWVMHSFWMGDKVESMQGLTFHYRQPGDVTSLLGAEWTDIRTEIYTEMEDEDSFWLMARKAR